MPFDDLRARRLCELTDRCDSGDLSVSNKHRLMIARAKVVSSEIDQADVANEQFFVRIAVTSRCGDSHRKKRGDAESDNTKCTFGP